MTGPFVSSDEPDGDFAQEPFGGEDMLLPPDDAVSPWCRDVVPLEPGLLVWPEADDVE